MLRNLIIAASIGLLSACSSMDRHVEYTTVTPESFPELTAVGYAPIAKQNGGTEQERVLQAMRASRLEAYRELVEQVQGVRISGTSEVSDMMLRDDQFRSQISGVIRGAEVVRSYPVGDDYYATELRLDFEQVHNLYIATVRPTKVDRILYY
ncbi:flagellar biosynthesis protein FlgP [Aliidiomarina sedimenti]|uniref:Flagellar biosynthesis protein FlgP n=2 Tax=Aliidiomarina TaxID=1249554 RepID=A0A432WCU0_9GAMM|nr:MULTISPECIES: LPP20 family lipoprotein [Aliidiomarina]RUO29875.1 flagellar biosynthesis protein FlgP [Aliidiomarina sedimenti]RUO30214.1 flagellar biosynthesis protein FlgP [Aliidiomarina soli]